jgi:hypothetical protein
VPAFQHRGADRDERAARHQGADDAPGQHPALLGARDVERAEDHDEQEQVVDAQALLEQVGREVLLRGLHAKVDADQHPEHHRHGHPHHAPHDGAPL